MTGRRVPWGRPSIGERERREVLDTLESGWLTSGPRVSRLEEVVADYHGIAHAVAVSNGTLALDLALQASGIGSGDSVILPSMTYVATLSCVLRRGALPVFADIDERTWNVDPEDVGSKIDGQTKAILVIDYGGQPCDYHALEAIAQERGVLLLQDGAQSLGGRFDGKPLAGRGTVSTMSFHAAKIMTTVEGGMVFTQNGEIAKVLRMLRNQGEDPAAKYIHEELGTNARMTDLQAAIGLAQWSRHEEIFEKRRQIARSYLDRLSPREDIVCPMEAGDGHQNGWFLFPILVPHRDRVARELRERGIDTRICYPLPVYEQPFYQRMRRRVPEACPRVERVTARILNLPMFHDMSVEDVDAVCTSLVEVLEGIV